MRITLVSIFLFYILANTTAQTSELKEPPSIKFGINLGLNYSNAFAKEPLPNNILLSNDLGFRLEVLAETQLFKGVFISPKLGISFNDSKLNIERSTGETDEYLILPVSLEFGTHFQFKKESPNSRPYFYVGPSIKIPIQEKTTDTSEYGSTWTPSIDIGIGLDKDFGYFQLSPELRYSIGLNGVSQHPNIGQVYFHNVSLIFNFLG